MALPFWCHELWLPPLLAPLLLAATFLLQKGGAVGLRGVVAGRLIGSQIDLPGLFGIHLLLRDYLLNALILKLPHLVLPLHPLQLQLQPGQLPLLMMDISPSPNNVGGELILPLINQPLPINAMVCNFGSQHLAADISENGDENGQIFLFLPLDLLLLETVELAQRVSDQFSEAGDLRVTLGWKWLLLK